ncbi:MAG TPA: 6-carboxytetrahydropterin synthase [Anaerolineales bacterium]|nr:6-carboxytetrahydropterin synthase [Anaerolineales bacterium]
MYSVAVRRNFIAQHFLIGGDWGAENQLHSHHYQLELQLQGSQLDEHGYLVDIVAIEQHLDVLVSFYRDQTLNDLPEFIGLNPSLERFAHSLCQQVNNRLRAANLHALTLTLWENESAWASYHQER